MKIAITLQSHDEKWGGIGVYTRQIVSHLLEMDRTNEYVLIYPPFGEAARDMGQYQKKYSNCIEVMTGRSIPWGVYWEQMVVPATARKHKIDLLFNPFWSVPVVGNYKKVLCVHGLDSHVTPEALKLRGKIEWALHSRVWVHQADAVISISDLMTRDLQRFDHLNPGNIRRIHHGRSPLFQPVTDTAALDKIQKRYQLPEKFLLFVGMLFPQKNFSTLLHAFKKIADQVPHDLVVVGRPRWKYSEEIELMGQLGLQGRVRFLSHIPHDELPALYSLADCFVFPSLYEAFGLVGLEAMACGAPVAASRTGALPEVLGDGAVYYDPMDADAMSASILRIVSDPVLRNDLRRRGLQRAQQFTWERSAREVLNLFRDVVEGRTVGATQPAPRAARRPQIARETGVTPYG